MIPVDAKIGSQFLKMPASHREIAVIIPALNEESAIRQVLAEIPAELAADVIVVDNGSTDQTAAVARQFGARVVTEPRRGYGQACLRGMQELQPQSRYVFFLDADHSDFPQQAFRLLEPLQDEEFDMVIGSRALGRAQAGALRLQQRWGNWLATLLIRRLYGAAYTDLGPFRALRRDALEGLRMKDQGFGWTVEMQVKAARLGLKVKEVPVDYRVRIGKSKISGTFTGTMMASFSILRTIFRYSGRSSGWKANAETC
ncbi:MAG TPA: glycosyltransferase family 2 protein [Acidobacteriota bacterium]|nr:glycosyltransferase family 2 protein [Acidobacteriota bacterium]